MRGGGIFLDRSLSLGGNSSFTNCSAYDGGAIYAEGVQMNFNSTHISSEPIQHSTLEEACMHTKPSLTFQETVLLLPTWLDLVVEEYIHKQLR